MEASPKISACLMEELAARQDLVTAELLEGLDRRNKKYINPKFFYDERGSQLFNQITALPEYYPTRTEMAILRENAASIAASVGEGTVLIEPGAGSCEKVRCLLQALKPVIYLPQDISAEFLYKTAEELISLYPWVSVSPLVGDFADAIQLPADLPRGRRILFYPGSTIGNFEPQMATGFLRTMRDLVGDDGGILIGVDLQKDSNILNAAYNDTAGVTAEFNRNILHHVNRLLGTAIDPNAFSHRAFYNDEQHRIEMHLVSEKTEQINCGDRTLYFATGESIHTEFSYKYTEESFAQLADEAGFRLAKTWTDENQLFSVYYLE